MFDADGGPLPPLPEGAGPSPWSDGDEKPARAPLKKSSTAEPPAEPVATEGEEIADVLRAAQDVAEKLNRVRLEELERLDEAQRACEEHVKAVEEEAAAMVAAAKAESAGLSAKIRAEAEGRLDALLAAQEALGNQLLESTKQMRSSVASGSAKG
jgi:hypothetical protein